MTGYDVVRSGSDQLRIGPWRSADRVGLLAPMARRPPSVASVTRGLDELARRGFREAVTPALTSREQEPFLQRGFTLHHRLHLLAHDLVVLPDVAPISGRRARRRDHAGVLAVDAVAFPEFWRLDRHGLDEAVSATPSHRFRCTGSPITAYAVWGRAGARGYLQRLAVEPGSAGRGLGSGLVADGLRWLKRRRVGEVLVNTQEDNERAVSLYERMGFVQREHGLAVLTYALPVSA